MDMQEIEAFLYRESDYLDAADLDGWISLYTDDASYWMPVDLDQPAPDTHISLFYDDRLMMELRRRNFGDAMAASMEYDVRCSHIIGNIRILSGKPGMKSFRVGSNFQACIYYRGEQTLYAGRYTHDLLRTDDGLRIQHKRVDLINCDAALGSIIIYL